MVQSASLEQLPNAFLGVSILKDSSDPIVADAQKNLALQFDLASVNLADVYQDGIVLLGKTRTYVLHQGEEKRSYQFSNRTPMHWLDVVVAYQTDTEGIYLGWAAAVKPNPTELLRMHFPYVANIEVEETKQRQGHGMRLVSLLHRISETLWGMPLGPGPDSYLSRDGRALTESFNSRGWLVQGATPSGFELVGTE